MSACWQQFRRRRELARWLVAPTLAWLALHALGAHWMLGLNAGHSLQQTLFLVERGTVPARGELIAFRWRGAGPYPAGTTFIKRVAGIAGDTVSRQGRLFLVNGQPLGQAKALDARGQPLEPGPTGVLPAGHYYVHAPHLDSLDSRYALTGWVAADQLIGRAHALF